jgi:protein MpaA
VRWALLAALLAATGGVLVLAFAGAGPETHVRVLLGRSVDGREIEALELGTAGAPTRVLVVGCIHGNEPAGIEIVSRLEKLDVPEGVDLWVVPNLNPDGVAAGTRGNAHGVDLNRNFPLGWRPQGGLFDSGPAPLSEPESRFAERLILAVRPRITIWFHQHLRVVDESGGDVRIERRFARLVGLPLRRLTRYGGSITTWQNGRFPGTTAFVVELPAGELTLRDASRYAHAVLELARPTAG